MVAGCGMTCIKYIVFAVNFLFFILGVTALGLGIYAIVDTNDMSALTKIDSSGKLDEFNAVGLLQQGAIVVIVAGAFLLLLGFLGCCGAFKEIKCLLATYAALVIIIIIIQLAAGGLAVAFRGRITDFLKEGLVNGIAENYDGNHTSENSFSRSIDYAQVYFECCGINNYTDFNNATKWEHPGTFVPYTCCKLKNKDMYLEDNKVDASNLDNPLCPATDPKTLVLPNLTKSCYQSIEDWIVAKAVIIIGIAFGVVFLEFLGVVFACCLYRSIEE